MTDRCPLPIPLPAQVVVAIRRDLLLRHNQTISNHGTHRRHGRRTRHIFFGFSVCSVYSVVHPLPQQPRRLRQVVLVNLAALRAQAEAVVLDLEEGDGVRLLRQRLVEDQDRGLDAGIGLEHPRRQRDDGDQGGVHEHLPQVPVGGLALEDDPLGHDDAGAAAGRQVLGHVVHEQHFAAFALHREAVVRLDAALRRHERRVGEDHVGVFVPAVLAGEGVVLVDVRVGEAVQIHVHQRQPHHVGRDVVAPEVLRQAALFVGGQRAVALGVGVGLRMCL